METICKICNSPSRNFDSAKILGKYDVNYFHCQTCGFVQTDEPFWLREAYSSVISSLDVGIVQRNINNARRLVFFLKFISDGICMDFGGGDGLLTRMMRDYGFDFYHYDKYAKNEYARGFEADMGKKYALITAFENFEHYVNPLDEIDSLMKMTDALFFSTNVIAPNPPLIKDWWYYLPVTGQHISFYTLETLNFVAKKHGCQLLSDDCSLHILSKTPIHKNFFKQLKQYEKERNKNDITKKIRKKLGKESRITNDFELILQAITKTDGTL